jgi:hypothetical protein
MGCTTTPSWSWWPMPSSSIGVSPPTRTGEKRWTCRSGPPPQPTLPAVRAAVLRLWTGLPRLHRCPKCRAWIDGHPRGKYQSSAGMALLQRRAQAYLLKPTAPLSFLTPR